MEDLSRAQKETGEVCQLKEKLCSRQEVRYRRCRLGTLEKSGRNAGVTGAGKRGGQGGERTGREPEARGPCRLC